MSKLLSVERRENWTATIMTHYETTGDTLSFRHFPSKSEEDSFFYFCCFVAYCHVVGES